MFKFNEAQDVFSAFSAKSSKDYFQKWGMLRMKLQAYKYDNYFDIQEKEIFVKDFINDPNVQYSLKTFSNLNNETNIGDIQVEKVSADVVPATITNMKLFDRLYDVGIVRRSGSISKCFDTMFDDILIADELRTMLLVEDSEAYESFSLKERNEFLFYIFKHLVLGRYCCQYEDVIEPYLHLSKHIYKDLLYVYKDSTTKKLQVGSTVLKVEFYGKEDKYLFPGKKKHVQNFLYLIVNPVSRTVAVWHHLWNV